MASCHDDILSDVQVLLGELGRPLGPEASAQLVPGMQGLEERCQEGLSLSQEKNSRTDTGCFE